TVRRLERNQNLGVHAADVVGRYESEVEEDRDADHIVDAGELLLRNELADLVFDLQHQLLRLFDTQAHGCPVVELHDAHIHGGKEIGTHDAYQHDTHRSEGRHQQQNEQAVAHQQSQEVAKSFAHSVQDAFACLIEAICDRDP